MAKTELFIAVHDIGFTEDGIYVPYEKIPIIKEAIKKFEKKQLDKILKGFPQLEADTC